MGRFDQSRLCTLTPTLRAMGIETALTLLSLLSFAALIVVWIAAPLHAEEEPTPAAAAEAPAHTAPA